MPDTHQQALSLTAVFVALAVGVAAGAAAVGSRLDGQEGLVRGIEQRFQTLQARLQEAAAAERRMTERLALYDRTLTQLGSLVVGRWLAGAEVQVTASGGAEKAAAALRDALKGAGARVNLTRARAGTAPAALVVKAAGRTVVGMVGPPTPGDGRLPSAVAALLAADASAHQGGQGVVAGVHAPPAAGNHPVSWVWEAESATGRLAMLTALVCGEGGPVDVGRALDRLAQMAGTGETGAGGERRRPCP